MTEAVIICFYMITASVMKELNEMTHNWLKSEEDDFSIIPLTRLQLRILQLSTEVLHYFWKFVVTMVQICRCRIPGWPKLGTEVSSIQCIKSVCIRSYSGPRFPAFGLNMEKSYVSLCIQSACGKMQTKITPNTDTF